MLSIPLELLKKSMAFVRQPLIQRTTADLERCAKKVTSQIEVTKNLWMPGINAQTEGWWRKGSENVEDSEWGGTMIKWERKANSKHKKLMVSRSKSRKTIGPCSSSVQAISFRRFPMIPLEQREGRGVWVMGDVANVCLVLGVCSCECAWSLGWGSGRIGCGMDFRCRNSWVMLIWWHGHTETPPFYSLSIHEWKRVNRIVKRAKTVSKNETKKLQSVLIHSRGYVYTTHTYTHPSKLTHIIHQRNTYFQNPGKNEDSFLNPCQGP